MNRISYSTENVRRSLAEYSFFLLFLGDVTSQKQTFDSEDFTDEIEGFADQILAENSNNQANDSIEYNCELCGKVFAKCKNLKMHVKTVHQGIKMSCHICTKEFCNKEDLKTHLRRVHEGDQNYNTCPTCRKAFSRPGNLYTHIKSVHKKLKDQKCDFCERMYSRKDALRKHIQTVSLVCVKYLALLLCNYITLYICTLGSRN